jgi:hypothetical protein
VTKSNLRIGALVTILDLHATLRSALATLGGFHDTLNLVKSLFAKRTLVFTIRPLFNASKTKLMTTSINRCEVLGFWFRHANTAVDVFGRSRWISLQACRRFLAS